MFSQRNNPYCELVHFVLANLEKKIKQTRKNLILTKKEEKMRGYMYILECSDGTYYTGSTNNLRLRLEQHNAGEGANYTKKRLPVQLLYYEEYHRIDYAFYREKQVQGWNRKKKEALINRRPDLLPELALAYRDLKKMDDKDDESE